MRVLNVIKRFRYLILAVTLTITSVVMGLLAGHGTVYKEKILPQTIEYGETFTPSAKAFMSSVVFEYSSGWSCNHNFAEIRVSGIGHGNREFVRGIRMRI